MSSKIWEGLQPGLLKPPQGLSPTWPEHRDTHTALSLKGIGVFIARRQVQNTNQAKLNFHPALFVSTRGSSVCPAAFLGQKHMQAPTLNPATSAETAGFTPPLAPR